MDAKSFNLKNTFSIRSNKYFLLTSKTEQLGNPITSHSLAMEKIRKYSIGASQHGLPQ